MDVAVIPETLEETPTRLRRPEILAPAGNEAMIRAAMENGADAVYLGVQQFNARIRAANFRVEDLPRIMAMLHERGMKGYVTLNTLIFVSELEEMAGTLMACSDAGVDAVLVQDLGVALLANAMVPGLPIHASTQMTVTSAESCEALTRLGLDIDRIVAARELSRREIRRMKRDTDADIEVFVHGAICVAYSGQCLTSEALGGRSANRGECAQACRLPYDLIVDGEPREVDGLKYLLSPKDLAAYEDIGDLIDLGIVSLKIEGRLKTPEYVAATVRSYREAVETAMAGAAPRIDEETRRRLAMTFSRGFTGGYLHEINHQAVVEGRFPKKRGLFLGKVAEVHHDGVMLQAEGPLKAGDGVVFDAGRPDKDEQGGRIYEIFRGRQSIKTFDPVADKPGPLLLKFGKGSIKFDRVHVGDLVWKTSDQALDAELRASFDSEKIRHRRPVAARVYGRLGEPLLLELTDEDGVSVRVSDTEPTVMAEKHPLGEAVLRDQLGRMGNTPFELGTLTLDIEGDLMVPKSRLNELRRQGVLAMIDARRRRGTDRPVYTEQCGMIAPLPPAKAVPPASTSKLSVLCRTLEQVEAVGSLDFVDTIYTDFENILHHREARKLIPAGGPRFAPATLRVVKPGEAPFVRKLMEAGADAVLIRNLASWVILQEQAPDLPVIGDYALNVANHVTAKMLMDQRIAPLTPSYDLNIDQLCDLLGAAPADWFEVTIHQYMPLFHMEHCVFCRYLSDGTDYTNCGRPCEKHTVALRDRVGYEHLLKADAGCRNTVFNATAQSASAYLDRILDAGVRRFRVDLLAERAEQAVQVASAYLPYIRGERSGGELWRELRATSKLGVTKGSLDHE